MRRAAPAQRRESAFRVQHLVAVVTEPTTSQSFLLSVVALGHHGA
jgi:hypothetical protein